MYQYYNDLFVSENLPPFLSQEEIEKLAIEGTEESIQKIIEHNIRLAIKLGFKYGGGGSSNLELCKELISLASFALVKAAHSYQVGKSSFLTYASSCITNEIFMYFRSNKKYQRNLSLYQSLDEDNPEFILEDTLTSDFDLEEIFVHSSDIAVIRNLLNSLTDRERVIVMLYYGFYNDQQYTHSAIAGILGVSQSYVSKLHARIISKLRKKYDFQKYGSKGDVSTIYEIFSAYSVEFVDYAISMLNENDTQIIYIRYGKDLHHPVRYFNWDCEWEVLFTRVLLNIQKNLDKYTNRKNFVLQKRGSVYDET